jgi:F-type H+-transporting ATPase subunit b
MFLFANLHFPKWLSVVTRPESNVINWLILVSILAYFAAKYLPPLLAQRKAAIEGELKAAKEARDTALALLENQKQKEADADKEGERILAEAKQAAEQMRLQIEEQTKKGTADLLKKFEGAVATERQIAISQMRAVAIRAAIKLAEENLRSAMTEEARAKLLTQFVSELDNISEGREVMSSGQFGVHIQ